MSVSSFVNITELIDRCPLGPLQIRIIVLCGLVALVEGFDPQAGSNAILVTVDNFNRAEADLNFGFMVKDGALGKFVHHRELSSIDNPIVRPNRDTLYSMSVFDLDAGPVTITLPDAGKRFMSLQVIDEDQYTQDVLYGGGSHTFTRQKIRRTMAML